MAKGKPKSSIAKGSAGRKNHGPKTHLHHDIFPKALRYELGKAGILTKFSDFESWQQACLARGRKNVTYAEFIQFRAMPRNEQRTYLDNIRRSK